MNYVMQIGFGGIGSILMPLIIKELVPDMSLYWLVDNDYFSNKNLLNQNVTSQDKCLGKPKAYIAAKKYNVVGIHEKYNHWILQKWYDELPPRNKSAFLVSAVDNLKTRVQIAEDLIHYYEQIDVIWIDVGVYYMPKIKLAGGQVKVMPDYRHAERFLHFLLKQKEADADCTIIPPSVHTTAAVLAVNSMLSVSSALSSKRRTIYEYEFICTKTGTFGFEITKKEEKI